MRKIIYICAFIFILLALFACTKIEDISIDFNSNGGNEISEIIIDANSTTVNLPEPVKEGFEFDGWYFDEDLTELFSLTSLLTYPNPTLYAKWIADEQEIFTITFESNGGSAVAPILLSANESITLPNDPLKEGFNFKGWYSDQALITAYTFMIMPEENITLYAKWAEIITITFNSNGGSQIAAHTDEFGARVSESSDPIREGYTFDGWYTDQDLTNIYIFTTMPVQNITLYAKWNPITYTIIFETNDGSDVDDINLDYQETIPIVIAPTKIGYEFVGWYEDTELTVLYHIDTMPLNGITLYAKWVPALVEVNIEIYLEVIELGSFDLDRNLVEEKLTGSTYTHNPNDISGFIFDSSYPDTLEVIVNPDGSSTIELYYTRDTFTITYDSNDGTSVLPISGLYEEHIVHPLDPTKVGYEFDGWYKNSALEESFLDTTFSNTDITLYAKWDAVQSTLAFETNGGEIINDLLVLTGETLILPVPVKEGYEFVNWYESEMYEVVFNKTTMPAGYTLIYAKWTLKPYNILYEEVGGSIVADENNFYQEIINEPAKPIKTDFIFDGWYLDNLYENIFLFDKMPAEDLVLYAKWIDATVPTSIAVLKNQVENTSVNISGIVYGENASLYPGFYIYDETGYVYIDATHTTVNINDLVSLDGDLAFDGDVVYITNVSNIVVNSNNQTEKIPQELTLAEVGALNVSSQYLINNLYEAEGILVKKDDQFSIVDTIFFDDISIYGQSFLNDRIIELDALVLDRVEFTYILVYKNNEYQISIVNIDINSLTEVEKISIIKELLFTNAFEPYYQEGSLFELFSSDPFGFVNLEYLSIGDNALYYDMTTHMFLDVEEETVIDFKITLTSVADSLISNTFTIGVLVKPIID